MRKSWFKLNIFGRRGTADAVAFSPQALVPLNLNDWDKYDARVFRYVHGMHYYYNSVYTDLETYVSAHRANSGLYKYIRGIYNPVARLVDYYVANVYGGELDTQDGTDGAIPILANDPRITQAIATVWQWSDWQNHKSDMVRFGAMQGDVVLKIVNDRAKQRVRIQVIDPRWLKYAELDDEGNVVLAVISYDRRDPETNQLYTYTEILSDVMTETYKNGSPHAYYQDAFGQPLQAWENPYRFTPIVIARHKSVGSIFGATPYHNVLPKIDEANEQASLANDQARKTIRPIWFITKATGPDSLNIEIDRDELPAIYAPEGAAAVPLIANIDLAGMGSNLKDMLEEIKRDLPELALDDIRKSGSPPSGTALSILYADAGNRTIEARGQYNAAMIKAHHMAIAIGAANLYPGFTAFSLNSYLSGLLSHRVKPRPVFSDTLSRAEKINFLQAGGSPAWLWLQEMEYPDEVILRATADMQQNEAAAVSAFAGTLFGDTPTIPDNAAGEGVDDATAQGQPVTTSTP